MAKAKNQPEGEAFLAAIPEEKKIRSLGVIMDGNGRWAKARALPRTAGHIAGAKVVPRLIGDLRELGVRTVTLYAFSTENWKRPKPEVDALMGLLARYMKEVVIPKIESDPGFGVRFLGDLGKLSPDLADLCRRAERMGQGREFLCNIAFNYGGREEILHAANEAIAAGELPLTEEILERHLYTAGIPDPDLIIRTAGESRLSGFLLWQAAYSEIYITKTLWPDFSREDLVAALCDYYRRTRRFGGLAPEEGSL